MHLKHAVARKISLHLFQSKKKREWFNRAVDVVNSLDEHWSFCERALKALVFGKLGQTSGDRKLIFKFALVVLNVNRMHTPAVWLSDRP